MFIFFYSNGFITMIWCKLKTFLLVFRLKFIEFFPFLCQLSNQLFTIVMRLISISFDRIQTTKINENNWKRLEVQKGYKKRKMVRFISLNYGSVKIDTNTSFWTYSWYELKRKKHSNNCVKWLNDHVCFWWTPSIYFISNRL